MPDVGSADPLGVGGAGVLTQPAVEDRLAGGEPTQVMVVVEGFVDMHRSALDEPALTPRGCMQARHWLDRFIQCDQELVEIVGGYHRAGGEE